MQQGKLPIGTAVQMRKYCDTDDIEATEFGKENAVDD